MMDKVILFLVMTSGGKEPTAAIPGLGTYEVSDQVKALEMQAQAMDKMLVITAHFEDWPVVDEVKEAEEDGESARPEKGT